MDDAQLARANGRLLGVQMVANELAGPPLGATLFATGMALPFRKTETERAYPLRQSDSPMCSPLGVNQAMSPRALSPP